MSLAPPPRTSRSLAPRYDAIVIGAGVSGLAAGIRLAQFEKSVVVLERHALYGGLNSFYKRAGRRLDTGLHALTNYVPRGKAGAPLTKLLRQLRIAYDDLALSPQSRSEIVFPGARLAFSNDFELLRAEVAREFPTQRAAFERLVSAIDLFDAFDHNAPSIGARAVLAGYLAEPLLSEMLLCPIAFYGSATEHDVDWALFVILFRSIFHEGLAYPQGGIKRVLDLLVRRYREAGGTLAMNTAVARIVVGGERATGVELSDGTRIEAGEILSSAGWAETTHLCGGEVPASDVGKLSFVESISVMNRRHAQLGHSATMTFFSARDSFRYARPSGLIDAESGVICCTDNYQFETPLAEGIQRTTMLASFPRWTELDEPAYRAAKEAAARTMLDASSRYAPDPRPHTVYHDVFTPRTIRHYTGHRDGAVYGSPSKHRDGRSGIESLHLIGTDQGLVGVIGAALSGITMANRHVLVAH